MFFLGYEITLLFSFCEWVNEGEADPAWKWEVRRVSLVGTSKCEAGWGTEHVIRGGVK